MEETAPAVLEIGLVLVAAAAAGWLVRRVGLPATIGYLGVGLVISPFTPGYVANREQIQLLADVGIVLLLFEVGIEVDLVRLGREQRGLFVVAPAQVLVTTATVAAVAVALGLEPTWTKLKDIREKLAPPPAAAPQPTPASPSA